METYTDGHTMPCMRQKYKYFPFLSHFSQLIPGYKKYNIQLLYTIKHHQEGSVKDLPKKMGSLRSIEYLTFNHHWKMYKLQIKVTCIKAMSDLYWICQKRIRQS